MTTHQIEDFLHASSHMKDLGPFTYFLGLEVQTSTKVTFINQHKYIKDLIALARLEDSTPKDTLMEVSFKYNKDDKSLLFYLMVFRQLVESLVYLTITHLNISHDVHLASQVMTSFSRYPDTRWMYLRSALMSWKCKKQDHTSNS